MITGTVVRFLVLGLGTLAGAAAVQQPAPAALPGFDATWRAVVLDRATEALLLLDPAKPKPVPVGPVVAGFIFEPPDPSRLVILRPGAPGTAATIFSQAPARTVGPVSLDDCWIPQVNAGVVAFENFRRGIVVDVPGHLILGCRGMLVSLDLEHGTAARQPVPMTLSTLRLLDAERVLAVSADRSSRPSTTELGIYDARTLAIRGRMRAEGQLVQPALVSGGREIVLIDQGDAAGGQQPTTLRYFDATTSAETRTVSLGAPFPTSRVSADGRFVYATNMNRNTPKQTARELRIIRAETGEALEKVDLLEHASWFMGDSSLPVMIEDRRFKEPALSRLLVLDEGRVRAILPVHNFVYQLSVDRERGQMYLLDGRSLAVYTWPGLQLEKQVAIGKILDWGGRPSDEPFMSPAPGATRALVVSGARAVAVDLVAGTALPEAKLGSSGARAGKFWGDAAWLTLAALTQSAQGRPDASVLPGSPFDPVPVAFSADGRTAMLPAPTGQITTIDVTTGRALRHVPGGDGAIAFAGAPMVIAADKQSSWVLSVATGDVVARFAVPVADADAPLSASVSPDGRLLLIGRGAAVHLLETATGRTVSEWTGFGRVGAVRFLRNVPAS